MWTLKVGYFSLTLSQTRNARKRKSSTPAAQPPPHKKTASAPVQVQVQVPVPEDKAKPLKKTPPVRVQGRGPVGTANAAAAAAELATAPAPAPAPVRGSVSLAALISVRFRTYPPASYYVIRFLHVIPFHSSLPSSRSPARQTVLIIGMSIYMFTAYPPRRRPASCAWEWGSGRDGCVGACCSIIYSSF